jgi:hypothetical protein
LRKSTQSFSKIGDDGGMQDAKVIAGIRPKFRALRPEMDERMRRQWAASEARELGWGGVSLVAAATGLSRPTITVGRRELELPPKQRATEARRIRRPGSGVALVGPPDAK